MFETPITELSKDELMATICLNAEKRKNSLKTAALCRSLGL